MAGRNGNKVHGRNKEWCKGYKARGQREKNKRRKVASHLKRHPKDLPALKILSALEKQIGKHRAEVNAQ